MFGLIKALAADAKALNILAQQYLIDVRSIAPKGTRQYELLIRYMKGLRDYGANPEFIAEHLAYNYNNYGSLTRLDT